MTKCSVDDILEFAIVGEIAANRFYMDMAAKMKNPAMAKAFTEFAKEELGHKAKLEAVKCDKSFTANESTAAKVADLKIADYTVDVEPTPDMDYQDALILAMKNEKAAYRLYTDLAGSTEDENLSQMFAFLAQEEAKHKLRFEIEYDNEVMKEN